MGPSSRATRPSSTEENVVRPEWWGRASELARRARARPQFAQPVFSTPEHLHPTAVVQDVPQAERLGQDSASTDVVNWAGVAYTQAAASEGLTFLGYAYLSEILQRPEYRVIVESISSDMTREWIELEYAGEGEKTEELKKLNDEFERLKLRDVCKSAIENDGGFGRGHLYLVTERGGEEDTDHREELATTIGDGLELISSTKVGLAKNQRKLKAIRAVEPIWAYPTQYNSNDPLKDDWYVPKTWMVMGKEVHHTRFLTLIGRPVPDILKPAYSFGGLPLTQMCKPYVDNWLRTRQSVSDLIRSFSVSGLKTDLSQLMMPGGGGDSLFARIDLFNALRDNHGAMVLGKNEEWFNVQTSLATLDHLQAQSQEHMSAVSQIPLVKLTGITPSGLNASSEGEIRVYYDRIAAFQEWLLRSPITIILRFAQLSLFGKVDPGITFKFKPLWQLTEQEETDNIAKEAQADDTYVAMGALDPAEVRRKLATDKNSPYVGLNLDPEKMPEPPPPEDEELPPDDSVELGGSNGGPPIEEDAALARKYEQEEVDYTAHAKRPETVCAGCVHFRKPYFCEAVTGTINPEGWCQLWKAAGAQDKSWEESQHPRQEDGKFGKGGGSAKRASAYHAASTVNGERRGADGGPLPEHISKLKIPPAWSDVRYAADPDADLLVTGRDAKGRRQAIYAERFQASQAAVKFARIKELDAKLDQITEQNEAARRSDDPRKRDAADALALIMATGVRPGSDEDTQAAKKAYGATTLEGRHVVTDEDGNVRLRFTGKKGVDLDLPVEDADIAAMLKERAGKAGADGKLFPNTDAARLLEHTHSLDGGSFKTKDFRTLLGTRAAAEEVAAGEPPKTEAAYKRAVAAVAKVVSRRLGNTPTVALQSYISPVVFAPWRAAFMGAADD